MKQNGFGTTIRRWRRHNRMTQEDLAEKLGISQSDISRLENKQTVPTTWAILASLIDLGVFTTKDIKRLARQQDQ